VQKPSWKVAVVMQRRPTRHKQFQLEHWEAIRVHALEELDDAPRRIHAADGVEEWLYPNLQLVLRRDEAEGYYLNVSTGDPRVFVKWRMHGELAVPEEVSASYNDASTWMDAGESVDPAPMPAALSAWVGEFVQQNYRPEPRKRKRPQSFLHPKDRG
jgi:Protein of unknown function (DUF3305)